MWEFSQTNTTMAIGLVVLVACLLVLALGHGREHRHSSRLRGPKPR